MISFKTKKMTSKHSNQYSRRYPLKRVRPDNENCGEIISSNSKSNKKLCRQPSQGFVQNKKRNFLNLVFSV